MSHRSISPDGLGDGPTVSHRAGEVVGSYRLLGALGEGGMGVVYLAEHVHIGRRAAIKMLRRECCSNPLVMERFVAEARATVEVAHPGVVEVLDFGHHTDGRAFIVMEHLAGESLAHRMAREGALPAPLLVEIARQVAAALSTAHDRRLIHRDLKPENIFLVPCAELPSGLRVKVLDFGIAKLIGDATRSQRTRTGAILGTPAFMSPEQCRGAKDIDHRTDIYALGCVMYAMATGRPPFVGEGYGDVMAGHLRDEPPRLASLAPGLPAPLEAVILRTLAKDASRRQTSMHVLASELDQIARALTSFSARVVVPQPERTRLITLDGTSASARERTRPTTLGGAAIAVSPRAAGVKRSSVAFAMAAAAIAGILCGQLINRGEVGGAAVAASPAATLGEERSAVPSLVRLTIESTPTAAEVRRATDGTLVGRTPFVELVPGAARNATYLVRMAGYQDARVSLSTDGDHDADLRLHRESASPRSRDSDEPRVSPLLYRR